MRLPKEQLQQLRNTFVEKYGGALADVKMLTLLDIVVSGDLQERHEATQRRLTLHRLIRDYQEDGYIAVVESGRDCDGVEYSGDVTYIDATVQAFDEHEQHRHEWADGPFRLTLERPSVARGIRHEARDLVLEAFEDGHPHCIRSNFL